MSEPERMQMRLDWEQLLYEGGYACPDWPREFGGRGLSLLELIVFYEECAKLGAPKLVNAIGKQMVGPTLMLYGTDEQKRRFLPKIISNQELWCQGYSEPNAGSDLANLRTRAVLDGDQWVISGQKIWTSKAQYADWCFCLVRTDPTAPNHKGISALLVPMKQAGVTVKPLRQITDDSEFNEVFFDGARTNRSNVVGEVNGGWKVAMALLGFERGGTAIYRQSHCRHLLDQVIAFARDVPRGKYQSAIRDPYVRHRIADLDIEVEALRMTIYRHVTRYAQGENPGFEGSVTKVAWSEVWQRVSDLAVEVMGPFANLYRGTSEAPLGGQLAYEYLESRGWSIANGTNEIQRNIIAERILGLPREGR